MTDFVPKTDTQLAGELRDILQAYCDKANELKIKGLVANFSISNGADGKPAGINTFEVIKQIKVPDTAPEQA